MNNNAIHDGSRTEAVADIHPLCDYQRNEKSLASEQASEAVHQRPDPKIDSPSADPAAESIVDARVDCGNGTSSKVRSADALTDHMFGMFLRALPKRLSDDESGRAMLRKACEWLLAASPVEQPAPLADALTENQRQALGEALTEYFVKLDSDGGIRTTDNRILRSFDYHDSRNIDDLIDRAIVPALTAPHVEHPALTEEQVTRIADVWEKYPGAEFLDRLRAMRAPAEQPAAASADEIRRRAPCIKVRQ